MRLPAKVDFEQYVSSAPFLIVEECLVSLHAASHYCPGEHNMRQRLYHVLLFLFPLACTGSSLRPARGDASSNEGSSRDTGTNDSGSSSTSGDEGSADSSHGTGSSGGDANGGSAGGEGSVDSSHGTGSSGGDANVGSSGATGTCTFSPGGGGASSGAVSDGGCQLGETFDCQCSTVPATGTCSWLCSCPDSKCVCRFPGGSFTIPYAGCATCPSDVRRYSFGTGGRACGFN